MSSALRRCRPDEAADLLALWRAAGAAPTTTDDIESLQGLMAHDPDAVIVAVDDGRLVGSVIAGWDGWRGSIYRMVVATDHRRHGLARRLLAEAEHRLRSRGAKRLAAVVVEQDPRAVGFWRGSGWDEQRDRVRFVRG